MHAIQELVLEKEMLQCADHRKMHTAGNGMYVGHVACCPLVSKVEKKDGSDRRTDAIFVTVLSTPRWL